MFTAASFWRRNLVVGRSSIKATICSGSYYHEGPVRSSPRLAVTRNKAFSASTGSMALSSSTTQRRACLSIGLKLTGGPGPSPANKDENSQIDPRIDPAKGHLEKEIERAKAKNLDLSFLLVDLANTDTNTSIDDSLAELRSRLKGREYAVVTIGFGVRGNREYTDAFEKIVNTCVQLNPGGKLGFAIWPDDVVASCERVLV